MPYSLQQQFLRNIIPLCITLGLIIQSPVCAFFAFEQVNIDPTELSSSGVCDVVTSGDLLAYHCATSFKVFDTTTETPTVLYQTTRQVA